MSRIVTFYSYKGGVGRTLALANIGVLLARRGKRVLIMDWDLEAPGLDRYFRCCQIQQPSPNKGVMQLLSSASTEPCADWEAHVQQITLRPEGETQYCTLSFIPSGVAAPDYAEQVRRFSWADFLAKRAGGTILERWREEWKREFDLVLIDSRTGITDMGGICTILLPDFLVLVFASNEQNLDGTCAVARNAQVARANLSVQRHPLIVLPVLSRFDGRDEIELAQEWKEKFASALQFAYADWLPKQYKPIQMIELTKIPYVTRFSFGEPLPVLTHSLTDPDLPGFYLENCTRLLASDFRDAAQIIDPSAPKKQDCGSRIRSFIQQSPIDEQELRRLLAVAEEELGQDAEFAALLTDAGLALSNQARYSAAEALYESALAIYDKVLDPNHPSVAASLNNLALLFRAQAQYGKAEPLTRRALAISEQVFGSTHPNVAIELDKLAKILRDTNRLSEAEPLVRRALAINEKALGPMHPNVATDLGRLAQVLKDANQASEAEPLIRRSLAINEKALGPMHPNVGKDLSRLAEILRDTNRLSEAELVIRRALAIDEQTLGPMHPTVATDLGRLAQILRETNRLSEAETLMRRALVIDEETLGSEHPAVAKARSNLAQVRKETKRLARAERLVHWLDNDVTAAQRVKAGRILARLGDPRPGVATVDGMEFCLVPAGAFLMGSQRSDVDGYENERPEMEFDIPYEYWIARYPVTVAQYRQYVAAMAEAPDSAPALCGPANHPVVQVSWHDARAFCGWLDSRLRETIGLSSDWSIQLPSEPEWEKASRGGLQIPSRPVVGRPEVRVTPAVLMANPLPARRYPWGDEEDFHRGNWRDTGIRHTCAVGLFPTGGSPYGCLDMAGNVSEWTRSLYGEYPYVTAGLEQWAKESLWSSGDRTLRGGGFDDTAKRVRCAARLGFSPDLQVGDFGFRVVLAPHAL